MRDGRRSWRMSWGTVAAMVCLALGGARGAAAQGNPLFHEVARLSPSGAAGLELRRVTLSGDGSRVLLGYSGVVFVFARTAGVWAEEARLDPPAGAPVKPLGAFDQSFGSALALSGDGSLALVGGEAPCAADPAAFCQAAWTFTRQGSTWSGQGALPVARPWSPVVSQRFADLSSDGATALVGVPCFGPPGLCDAALVYVRSGNAWSVQGHLAVPREEPVGGSVALSDDGNLALVGGNGYDIHLFTRTGGIWSEGQIITPAEGPDRLSQKFGTAIDLNVNGGIALIGDPGAICGGLELGTPCGSAQFFRRTGGSFARVQAYEEGDDFENTGGSVALSGDGALALVTQPGEGATQVLLAAGASWAAVQELPGSEASPTFTQESFADLSQSGRTALIGNVVFEQASVVAIPTLGELGLLVLGLLLAASGAVLLARRRPVRTP